mgnify:CR=1 FL=1
MVVRALMVIAVLLATVGGAWFTIGPGAGPPVGRCTAATYANADRSVPDGADGGDVVWDGESRFTAEMSAVE